MNAEIITVGDELLIGQVVDTNSAWMGKELNLIGVRVKRIYSVSDDAEEIIQVLTIALSSADIVLITGGLGPTRDDLTKHTLARFFNSKLEMNALALENVKRIFSRFNRPMLDTNFRQAELPDNCIPIQNDHGTAPGMWFDQLGKVIVSMPGVPHEMKAMMAGKVLPMLQERFHLSAIVHRTLLIGGIGESFLAERLVAFENGLPKHIKLAYLPHLGTVRLRLSGLGSEVETLSQEIEDRIREVKDLVPEYIIACYDCSIQEAVLYKMKELNKTLSLAESCTGGYLSHLFTSISGSSAVFQGSFVVYSNALKTELLGVAPTLLEQVGAVSEEAVRAMIGGVLKRTGTDYAIAITGIAGPDGGSEEKPVGCTWIAVGDKTRTEARKFSFYSNRMQNIERAAISALLMLIHFMEERERDSEVLA